mmetsp:Transcript_13091/g.42665  ORF Transcript_13091/g.42665 Transcript_13091/m.42665 type:complete len:106 (+) Transcript_13091:510-827(+)
MEDVAILRAAQERLLHLRDVSYVLFAAEPVTITDLALLQAVVATNVFVVAHDDRDTSPCRPETRDWIEPLLLDDDETGGNHKEGQRQQKDHSGLIRRAAYHLVPR